MPHRDPAALAAAVRRVLTEPGLAAELTGRTHALASAPAVAGGRRAPSPLPRRGSLTGRTADRGAAGDPFPAGVPASRPAEGRHRPVRARATCRRPPRARLLHRRRRPGLVVVSREPSPSHRLIRLSECYLTFLTHAQDESGAFRNRLGFDRHWIDEPGLGDWWGRAMWGLGTAAARNATSWSAGGGADRLRHRGPAALFAPSRPWPSPGSARPRCCGPTRTAPRPPNC